MPESWGGPHVGPEAMLTEVWAPAWRRFRARPVPECFLSCDDGTVVVTGTYVGQPRDATAPLSAAFAHVIALRDGQVCELRQITDTQRWAQAAADTGAGAGRRLFAAADQPHRLAGARPHRAPPGPAGAHPPPLCAGVPRPRRP